MKKYIFPTNYKYANKFLGIIEYRVLLPLSIYAGIIFLVLYLCKVSFFWGTGIFIVLVLPPVILLGVGVGGESVVPFLMSIYKFKKNAKVYLYNRRK
ncbi:MAG: hypothetical protein IJ217_00860 [Clostridia bacterium]|nr:hypothetical protein [Clostridia bacterium]